MLIIITPPDASYQLLQHYGALLSHRRLTLHLRFPGAPLSRYEEAILSIPASYRTQVVVSDYPDLALRYGLGGVHLRWGERDQIAGLRAMGLRCSVSVHSMAELQELSIAASTHHPTYALLSPYADSYSKPGYPAAPELRGHSAELRALPFPVVALGGITPEIAPTALTDGYSGVALIGYLSAHSDHLEEALARFAPPVVLSVAGHDPTSGAGIVADALTIERLEASPTTIATVLTAQSDDSFGRYWVAGDLQVAASKSDSVREEQPYSSLSYLLTHSTPPIAAKLGMATGMAELIRTAQQLRSAGVRYIVWDPIIAPTYGEALWQATPTDLCTLLRLVDIVTPNLPEAAQLFGRYTTEEFAHIAHAQGCALLLTGGHSSSTYTVEDQLWTPDGGYYRFVVPRAGDEKHGTGCRLSAAIATYLSHGYSMPQACRAAQWDVDEYRRSSTTRRGSAAYSAAALRAERIAAMGPYFVTDGADESTILSTCRAVLEGGIRTIQLRMKGADTEQRLRVAQALRALTRDYIGATLIINDDIDTALRCDADGVHLGLQDQSPVVARSLLGPHKIIGGTCNSTADIRRRALEGVDYVGVGPLRHTTTKSNLSALLGSAGMSDRVATCQAVPHPLPCVAIGGIELGDLPHLAQMGVSAPAISGLITRAADPKSMAAELVAAWRRAQGEVMQVPQPG